MRRKIFALVILLISLLNISTVMAKDGEFSIKIDDEILEIPNDMGYPYIDENGRTQIPLRSITQGLGHKLKWYPATKTIKIYLDKSLVFDEQKDDPDSPAIELQLGSNMVKVPRKAAIQMDTKAMAKDGRTFVPIRFVTEALGYSIPKDIGYRFENGIRYITILTGEMQSSEDNIMFEDPRLEQAVREKIGKPEGKLTKADVENIQELKVEFKKIESLEGLQYLTGLTSLRLDFNNITDLSPIANLQNLRTLFFSYNQVEDLTPLANLENLRDLRFRDNQVKDITPLESLKKLEIFVAENNQLEDINVLADKQYLRSLYISNNHISDVSPLANLTNLRVLVINHNNFSDITALKNLTNLTMLMVNNNQITDISPLKHVTELTTLNTAANSINDITPLSDMINMEYLNIGDNKISDISVLQNLPDLEYLNISRNHITDISVLSQIPHIKELSMTKLFDVSDINVLTTLNELKTLYIDSYSYDHLDTIQQIPNLEHITFLQMHTTADEEGFRQYTEILDTIYKFEEDNILANMSDYEKVKAVNKFLIDRITYGVNPKYEVNTYSELVKGWATCGGYTQSAEILLDKLGIENINVHGNMDFYHTWNLVKIDGAFYHLDVTWNETTNDWFLLSDSELSKDHKWDKSQYPATPSKSYQR